MSKTSIILKLYIINGIPKMYAVFKHYLFRTKA